MATYGSRLLRSGRDGRLEKHSTQGPGDSDGIQLWRERLSLVFWAWNRFLASVLATAVTASAVLSVIHGHAPDSALVDWIRAAVSRGAR